MIPSLAKKVVDDSRREANVEEWKAFMAHRHECLSYWNGETEDLTRKYFSDNLVKNVPMANVNVTRRVIERTSEVYMVETDRFFPDNPTRTDKYNEWTGRKFHRMQRIERMANLLDVVAVHPYIPVDSSGRAMNVLDYRVLIEFQPFFDANDNLIGVRYPLVQSANTTATDEQVWVEWGRDGYVVMNDDGLEMREEGYNGPFPFVLAWREEPDYFYDHNPSTDLIKTNLLINFYETILAAGLGYQAFGQPYATGLRDVNDARALRWDVSQIIGLPEGASMGMLNPSITASQVIEAEKNAYKMLARDWHLPEDFVEGAQAESGVAIRLRNQELQNERRGDVARWRDFERRLYEIERFLLGGGFPEVLHVDFSESVEYLSEQEQRERDEWDLAHNLTTLSEIAMRRNPDLDADAAKKMILDNAAENGGVKKAEKPSSPLADLLAGNA